jgi:hypothetical protein
LCKDVAVEFGQEAHDMLVKLHSFLRFLLELLSQRLSIALGLPLQLGFLLNPPLDLSAERAIGFEEVLVIGGEVFEVFDLFLN